MYIEELYLFFNKYTRCSKRLVHQLISMTSLILDGFSTFFHPAKICDISICQVFGDHTVVIMAGAVIHLYACARSGDEQCQLDGVCW